MLQRAQDEGFWVPTRGYALTHRDADTLLVRQVPTHDGAQPSGNAIALINLLRLHALTQNAAYLQRAEQLLSRLSSRLERGAGAPHMLMGLDYFLDRDLQVAIVFAHDVPLPIPC